MPRSLASASGVRRCPASSHPSRQNACSQLVVNQCLVGLAIHADVDDQLNVPSGVIRSRDHEGLASVTDRAASSSVGVGCLGTLAMSGDSGIDAMPKPVDGRRVRRSPPGPRTAQSAVRRCLLQRVVRISAWSPAGCETPARTSFLGHHCGTTRHARWRTTCMSVHVSYGHNPATVQRRLAEMRYRYLLGVKWSQVQNPVSPTENDNR